MYGQVATNVGKRGNVARVLTPEERGPRPAWAYDARLRLGLTDVAVSEAIPGSRPGKPYDPATIRKAETGEEHMSRPLWKRLTHYYTTVARERRIALDPIPLHDEVAPPTTDMAALVAALDRQTKAINGLVARLESLASGAIREGVEEAIREAEELQGGGGSLRAQLPERLV